MKHVLVNLFKSINDINKVDIFCSIFIVYDYDSVTGRFNRGKAKMQKFCVAKSLIIYFQRKLQSRKRFFQ